MNDDKKDGTTLAVVNRSSGKLDMSEADELEAVRRTLARYNTSGDRMQLEALAATFTEDGVLETPTSRLSGRAGIAAGLGGGARQPEQGEAAQQPQGRRPRFVRHHLTTSLLELTGPDTAEGRTYFIVFTDVGPDHAGFYADKLRKVAGEWLFAHRRVMIDWMSEASLFTNLVAAHRARIAARGGA